jgi:hypothetical protein
MDLLHISPYTKKGNGGPLDAKSEVANGLLCSLQCYVSACPGWICFYDAACLEGEYSLVYVQVEMEILKLRCQLMQVLNLVLVSHLTSSNCSFLVQPPNP